MFLLLYVVDRLFQKVKSQIERQCTHNEVQLCSNLESIQSSFSFTHFLTITVKLDCIIDSIFYKLMAELKRKKRKYYSLMKIKRLVLLAHNLSLYCTPETILE